MNASLKKRTMFVKRLDIGRQRGMTSCFTEEDGRRRLSEVRRPDN
jgi:hypothetical protein